MKSIIPISMICLIMAANLTSCDDTCSSERILSERSLDGKLEAIFLKKDCGATTGFIYEIKIGATGESGNSGNLIFRFDDNHQKDWPNDDKELIGLRWRSDGALDVTLTKPVRIFHEDETSGNTAIHYHLKPGSNRI